MSPSVVGNASRSPAPSLHLPLWHFLLPFSKVMLGHMCPCSLPMTRCLLIQAVFLISVTELSERFSASSSAPQPPNRAGTDYIGPAALSCTAKPIPLTAGGNCWVRPSPGCSGAASSVHHSVPPQSTRLSSAVRRVQEGTIAHPARVIVFAQPER